MQWNLEQYCGCESGPDDNVCAKRRDTWGAEVFAPAIIMIGLATEGGLTRDVVRLRRSKPV